MFSPHTLRGNGRILPPYLDTQEPHAQAGTVRVRAVDPLWVVGLNRARGVFEVWGPSVSAGGWTHLLDVMDDYGRPLLPPVPWELVAHALHQGREEGEGRVTRIHEFNQRLREQRRQEQRRETAERTRYCQEAIRAEWESASRFSPDDVLLGLRNAEEGRTKRAERTELVSLPAAPPVKTGTAP